MINHVSGAIVDRLGSEDAVHVFRVTATVDLTGVARKIATITVGPNPVFYRVSLVTDVAFSGGGSTASVLRVGTTSGGNEIITDTGVWTGVAAGTNVATGTNPMRLATANTDIWIRRTDTTGGATLGQCYVLIEQWEAAPNATS